MREVFHCSNQHINAVIGRNIAYRRRQRCLTRKELAKRIGVSTSILNKYERGEVRIPASLLLRFSQILKTNIAYFYYFDIPYANENHPVNEDEYIYHSSNVIWEQLFEQLPSSALRQSFIKLLEAIVTPIQK